MKEAKLSPEQFGERLGISGMTIRRWKDLPSADELPDIYKNAVLNAVYQLVAEDKLTTKSKTVRDALGHDWLPFDMAAANSGNFDSCWKNSRAGPEEAAEALSQIGTDKAKRLIVDAKMNEINAHKKKGADWTYRITRLLTIIRSKKLRLVDKLIAYGAIFYLLNPFDFIPDHIPIFGFLDDFFFLGVAIAFYLKRYPESLRR